MADISAYTGLRLIESSRFTSLFAHATHTKATSSTAPPSDSLRAMLRRMVQGGMHCD
jgi:hypothetical protein